MVFQLKKLREEQEEKESREIETISRWKEIAEEEGLEPGEWRVKKITPQDNAVDSKKKYREIEPVSVNDQRVPQVLKTEETDGTNLKTSDSSLSLEEDLKRRFGKKVRSALGPGTVVEGKFSFDEPVCIEGSLSGEVISTSAFVVGEDAIVEAKIQVGSLIVLGNVKANVLAEDLVEIKSTGKLEGDILTDRLVIEEGGEFQGACKKLS